MKKENIGYLDFTIDELEQSFVELLSKRKIFSGWAEAKRIILSGGFTINGIPMQDIERKLKREDFINDDKMLLEIGKIRKFDCIFIPF